ncbi:gamma-glutamyltransferase [Tricladium varicosporioides]|nr:gamma-glutamyltransferase [Hymenoscyphus varicosporioides]
MQHSGLGGGGFMLVRGPDGEYESIDFRETAPAAAFQDMYQGNAIGSIRSGLASGVPGDIAGLGYLHRKYGLLPWRAICNPAIHVARYGFPVTNDLARYMGYASSDGNNFLTEDPQWSMDFAPNGTLLGEGDILTRKRYANTLEIIAKKGAKVFYEGELANYTIAAVQAANGTMTIEDLSSYRIKTRKSLKTTYRNYTLYTTPSPSSGSVAFSILNTLSGYNMSDPNPILNTHLLSEAMRFSYAARSELGDPSYYDYMDDLEASMLTSDTAAKIRSRISPKKTFNVSHYYDKPHPHTHPHHPHHNSFLPENGGTSHIVTSDASGLSITLTTTVNLLFGSHLVVPETGVIMNNEMNDFSIPYTTNEFGFPPSPINYPAPGKRPMSSITPIILEHPNGTLFLSIGAAGGSRIITGTVQAILNVVDRGMTLKDALKEPRIHDQLMPDITTFEYSFDNITVAGFKAKGHNVTWVREGVSAVQGVMFDASTRTFDGESEPRQKNSGGLSC